MSYATQQRSRDVRVSLDALKDGGFVRAWHERYGKERRWAVDYLGGERQFTTREAEVFVSGAKAVLFDRRIVAVLAP